MSQGNESGRPRPALGRSTPLLAVLLLLLAAWFGWSAVDQWMQSGTSAGLEQSRDQAVAGVEQALATQTAQFGKQLALEPVKAALASGDAAAVALAVRDKWTGVEDAQVLDASLTEAYADPAAFGYSRLALLEQAMATGQPVTLVVRDGGSPRLGLAAPVLLQGKPAVIYIRQPLTRLTSVFDGIDSPSSAFLGLRQGGFTIVQKGAPDLGNSADALARPVGDTGLRVVAELPDASTGLMGLGVIPSGIVALLLLAVALLLLLGRKRLANLPVLRRNTVQADDSGPTLQEALEQDPQPLPVSANARAADAPPARVEPGADAVLPVIFRAYDIRGVLGAELNANVATLIGQAIGSEMQAQGLRDVVVGRDGRLSGPELADALITGLRRAGCDVIDIGMAPTPVVYFASYHLRAGSCVAVTGSHNPPDYNGFKIVVAGETLSNERITALLTRLQQNDLASGVGSVEQVEILDRYFQRIRDDIALAKPMRVVVDCGNGVAGVIAPKLVEALGCSVIPLFCDVDGTFPNHHPDPGKPENLVDLIAKVKAEKADLGLAFDGDGDRVGVVTNAGHMIYPDRLMMLFAKDVVSRNPGADIIFDVKCTRRLPALISGYGGRPVMWKTGHSLIKAKMKETGALLAGEMSGHIFFKERWYGFDDGIYSAVRLLEILSLEERDAEHVFAAFPTSLSTPEINITVTDERKFQLIDSLQRDAQWGEANLTTLDGVRVDYAKGWGLIRASNTTPVLVLRFEADTEDELARIQDVFRGQLNAIAPDLKLPF